MKTDSAILKLTILALGLATATTMAAVPAIFNVSPLSGINGAAITISGTNFNPTAGSNIVYFGAVQANVLAATPASLVATVPSGATFGPITVTVGGLTAYSGQIFQPTFNGNGSSITANSFGPSFDIGTLASPSATVIADLDGDGKPDIVLVSGGGDVAVIYRNISTNGVPLGAGSFAPPVTLTFPTNGTSGSAYRIRAVDLDGDGKLDLIAGEVGGNRVSVFHNISTPGNLAFEPAFALIAGTDCRSVAAADLDGDGRVDIVALNYGDKSISLFRNIGSNPGTLNASSFAAPVVIAAPGGPYEAAIADLNGDGKPDLAVAESDTGTVSIFQNAGGVLSSNTFSDVFDLPCNQSTAAIVAVDLDGDGKIDLVAGSVLNETISVFQNISTGGTLTTTSFAPRVDFATTYWTHVLAIADFNGDSKPDLAVVGELPSTMSIFQNISTSGSLTNTPLAPRVDFGTGWNAWGVSAGDLDGDGRPDVVFCNDYDSTLQIYQNAMPFGPPQTVPPSIILQPTNMTVTVNDTAVFNVLATGTPPLSYQWNFNGTNISGATNASLTLSNVQPAQAGIYTVVVSDTLSSVTSSNAVLIVYSPTTPPTILAQSPNQVAAVSNTVTFSVMASGATPLSYFWSQDGVLIPGATNSSYTIYNVPLSDTGSSFRCLVTNAFGTAMSSNILLKVIATVANGLCNGAIVITNASYTNTQSTLQANAPGNPAPDCVAGFGHGVWYEFTAPLAGVLYVDTFGSDYDTGLAVYTGSCDSLTEVACNDDADGLATSQVIVQTTAGTTYYILAGGYNSDAGNLVLQLNHLVPPTFVTQPANISVVVSSNAIFSPSATGTLPISFQWYFNNTPLVDGGRISGSTSSTLTIANVQTTDGGNYQLVASNVVGVTTSAVAVLTPVILPPTVIQPPVSLSVGTGSNANFSAMVSGTPPYSYQWYLNGNRLLDDGFHIAGSTTSSLTISNVTTADAGSYNLIVTNLSGFANASATLSVLTLPVVYIQPVGRSVPPGLPTVFTGFASGNPAPKYQWQLNGTNIPGATLSTYTNSAIGTNDLGFYTLVASNTMGYATSQVAQLTFGPVAAWGFNSSGECLPPPGLSNVIAIAGTYGASFAVRADGTVVPWGSGIATNIPANMSNVVALAAGGAGNYALRADGTVVGWNGYTPPPLSNIVAVASGNYFALGLRADGAMIGWGSANYPVPTGLNHVTAVAASYSYGMALRSDGTIVAWGSGPATNVPAGLANVTAIAAGYTASLALKSNGTVAAWGSGTSTNLPAGLTNVVAISASSFEQPLNFCLAIRADGTVVAWGDNADGATNLPAGLNNLNSVAVAAAPVHGLALVNNGSPRILQPPVGLTTYVGRTATLQATVVGAAPLSYQWLLNGTAIPGATNTSLVLTNIQLANNFGSFQLFASNSVGTALSLPAPVTLINSSALTFLGQTFLSASNVYQGGKVTLSSAPVLGNGPLTYQWFFAPSNNATPIRNYAAVHGATNDTLVLDPALATQSGSYSVTVSNQFVGATSAPVAVRVMFAKAWGYLATDAPFVLTNATAIAVGNFGAGTQTGDYLALSSAGKISSWTGGFTEYGETNFSALSNSIVTAIAAGYNDTLALKSDGTVFAIGYGIYGETNVPAAANGIVAIACGDYHDLALRYDGTVVGWGQNFYGQATNPPSATNVVAIAAGGQDSIALRADGSVVTWGQYGGLPIQGGYSVPTNATNIVAVAAGGTHFLALRANGTVVGWGNNNFSQTIIPTTWTNIVAISAGGNHSTALRNDGTVMSIGSSAINLFSNNVPSDLTNVIAIASSGDHDLGLFGTRAPAFTVQPWSRTVFNTATSVWFSAKCAGVQPVRYQWLFNGTNVPGATNDTLTVNAATNSANPQLRLPLQAGIYQLVASNSYGVVASHYAQLSVLIPLGVALNATNFNWTTSGNVQWFGETNVTHDGVSAAQSGDIGPFQDTILQTTITNGPGTCSFWWKVSSELDFDFLEFRLNGIVQTNISGEVNWQQVSIPLPAGTNTLLWHYYKTSVFSSGLDAGWVDQVALVPAPVIFMQPASVTAYAGTTASFSVEASIGGNQGGTQPPLIYQWQKNGINLANSGGHIVGANGRVLTLNNVQDADAASYDVLVSSTGGVSVASSPATLTVLDSPPMVTSQPVSLTNYAGTTATFQATAVGAVPMSYQWQKNGVVLPASGTTSGTISLTLTNVQDADAASYAVIITNVDGSVTSSPALLTVADGPPVISVQPASATTFAGGTANFAVTAIGTSPLDYQWQFNGTNLNGAIGSMLAINNAQSANAGPYQVVITNTYGSTTSSIATLTLARSQVIAWGNDSYGQTNVPPGMTRVTAIAGGYSHSLALQANGAVVAWGLNDQGQTNVPTGLANVVAISSGWDNNLALRANGTVTAWGYGADGETNVPAGLTNVVAIASGWDHCLALEANGTVASWGSDSYGQTDVPAGLTNVVAIAAGGYHNLALQSNGTVVAWGYNGYGEGNVPTGLTNVVAIAAGAYHSLALQANGTVVAWGGNFDNQIYVPAGLTNVLAIAAGSYHSLALEADGTVVGWGLNSDGEANAPAGLANAVAIAGGGYHSLAIQSDGSPFITKQPLSQTVSSNTTVQFTVSVLGLPTLNYQWQKNGLNLTDGVSVDVYGSATPVLTVSNVQTADMAVYSVVIANSIGSITSSPAALTVAGPPVILLQPAGQTVSYGATVRFAVTALGNPPPAYQWWQNGTNQIGDNNSTLTLSNVARAQDGTYTVMVTNSAGGILSSNAVLKVFVPQQLGAPSLKPDGSVQLTSSDVGGGLLSSSDLANFDVQVSTNLVSWTTLPGALSLTNGTLLLHDPAGVGKPTRFYRIVEH